MLVISSLIRLCTMPRVSLGSEKENVHTVERISAIVCYTNMIISCSDGAQAVSDKIQLKY